MTVIVVTENSFSWSYKISWGLNLQNPISPIRNFLHVNESKKTAEIKPEPPL